MKNQTGFTLVELMVVIWFVLIVIAVGGGLYVAHHFISKFW
jgi:type II secretory pathway pseudopilin PulG